MTTFSPSQEAAVSLRGVNVTVSASAGSGKTSVLVERLCRQVCDEGVSVESILAMTFTEDAAREMKARLKVRLEERFAQTQDPRLASQLALLETASICTIDSFCYDIVKTYYWMLPIPYAMSQNAENGPKNRKAFQTALKAAKNSLPPKDLALLTDYFLALGKTEDDLEDSLRQFLAAASAKADPEGWMEEAAKLETDANLIRRWHAMRLQAMEDICQNALVLCESMEYAKIAAQEKDRNNFLEKLEGLKKLKTMDPESEAFKSAFLRFCENTLRFPKTINKYSIQESQERFNGFADEIASRFLSPVLKEEGEALEKELKQIYMHLALNARKNFQAEKRRMQILDFGDMEHFALALLEKPAVQEEVKARYAWILVDEFQDTNDLQEAIIGQITRGHNVFRVGDVKQSIYGFRQARPQIMQAYMASKDPLQKQVTLQENFRSDQVLIDFASKLFSNIMNIEGMASGFSPSDASVPGTDRQKGPLQHPVRFLLLESGAYAANEGIKPAEARPVMNKARWDVLAQDILAQNKKGIPFRSICILTRSHAPQKDIKEALQAWGIPVIAEVGKGFYENQAVSIVMNALKALQHPQDDVAMAGLLCSPLGKLSHAQLAQASSRPEGESLYGWLKGTAHMENFEIMRQWRQLPAADILRHLYNFEDFYYSYASGQDKTNLDYLLESAGSMFLPEFLEEMEAAARLDNLGEAVPYGKEENVVKVKTMHHSKGLQYPVVYLLSNDSFQNKNSSQAVGIDPDLGLAFQGMNREGSLKYVSNSRLAMEHKQLMAQMEEEMRILYVAVTRAEKELIFLDCVSGLEKYDRPLEMQDILDRKGYTDWVLRTFLAHPDDHFKIERIQAPVNRPEQKAKGRKGFVRRYYEGPVQAVNSATASGAKAKLSWPAVSLTSEKSTQRGTLFHEMAGKLAYPYTEADAQAYAKEHGQNLDARDLEQFLSLNEDPLYKSWMSMPHTFEESYILQSDGQIAHGFMDLVVQAPNETIVLDFKTDFVKNMEELKVRYAKQLDMYRWAMSRLRPGKPVHTYVYSFTLKEMKSFAD